jgi:hypothetical protein
MCLGYISESALLLGLPIAPLACFFELIYALQHSNEAQLREGHLDIVEKGKTLDKTICARSNPEYSSFW